ncbi:cyclic GMP-AMP synthase-like receptor isoform X2 [Achroia grisella]|nr:cyclic GMP-AMP synthase-like receptor isoform X2 [Achroia grisella]
MNNSREDNRSERREDNDNGFGWWTGLGAATAAIAGATYLFSRSNNSESSAGISHHRTQENSQERRTSYLHDLLERVDINEENAVPATLMTRRNVSGDIPDNPVINNLDSLLSDLYVRFIALRDDDFQLHYRVFNCIFSTIHKNMKEVDSYFNRYSSTAQAAGSHYDRLRIKKPDEFDMDIVIDLPLNMKEDRLSPGNSDVVLEPSSHGYIQLKMGTQYQMLPYRDDWQIHKTLYKWKDVDNYLLRDKFSDWFKGITDKALNKFEKNNNYTIMVVDRITYIITTSKSGPAITLKISDPVTDFKMSIDIVPALRFPEERWPVHSDYRDIPPGCSVGDYGWMVVPKPASSGESSRSWRLALHNQERKLFYNTYNLRQTVRYLKKLRDAQEMNEIASYYVKTLFFWEVIQQQSEERFWNQPLSKLFIIMVKKFQQALANRNIPYFWNKNHNLIDGVAPNVVAGYANKLKKLVVILDDPTRYKEVAIYLLTIDEYNSYKSILFK